MNRMTGSRFFSYEQSYTVPPRYFYVSLEFDANVEDATDELHDHYDQIRMLMQDRRVLMKGDYKDKSGII